MVTNHISIPVEQIIGVVGSDSIQNITICGHYKNLGLKHILSFESSDDILELLAIQNFSLLCVLQDIRDIHWTNLIRKIKADPELSYVPICLVLKEKESVTQHLKSFFKDYGITEVFKEPVAIEHIARGLKTLAVNDANKNSVQARLKKASALFRQGLKKQAKEFYEKILEQTSNLSAQSGLIQTSRENLEAFHENITKALELDPGNYSFKFEQLSYFLKEGDHVSFDRSMNVLFLELGDNKENFWMKELGEFCLNLGYSEYTEKIVNILIKNGRNEDWQQHVLLARAQLSEGRIEEAKLNLERAIKIAPKERADILNLQGVIARRNKDLQGSLAYFEKALQLLPTDHRIMYNIAICYKDLHNTAKCKEYLNMALKKNPEYQRAKATLNELNS